jgi:hypothetical protein
MSSFRSFRVSKLARCCAAAVIAAAAVAAVTVLAAGAQARPTKESERFELAREIPTKHFALLAEGRLPASYWAAFVYAGTENSAETVPCAYIGAIDFISPSLGFFKYAGECGELWPGEGAQKPALAFIHQRTSYHGHNRAEGSVLVLLAQEVRRIRIRFRGTPVVWAQAKELSGADGARAKVPTLRYATFAVHLDRCISGISAYDAGGKSIGAISYPRCQSRARSGSRTQ